MLRGGAIGIIGLDDLDCLNGLICLNNLNGFIGLNCYFLLERLERLKLLNTGGMLCTLKTLRSGNQQEN